MSQIRFAVTDAADIRFCLSPLWETVGSRYALADPGRHAIHLPWVRWARERGTAAELTPLREVARPEAWLPDFLTPPPPGPSAELEEELAVVAETPPEVVVADLLATVPKAPLSPWTTATLHDPGRLVRELVAAIRIWHDVAIAPHWPRMRALLEADIAHRARQLAEGGVRRLFDTLHPTVRWAGDRIVADDPWDIDYDLRGRGLPLMPSVFVDRRVLWSVRTDSPPIAVYPARGAAVLWESVPGVDGALAAVVGTGRARLLEMLRHPATTTELARRTGLSPSAVSQHLRALHAAGLVARGRHGRSVLYLVTAVGAALLDAVRDGGSVDPAGAPRVSPPTPAEASRVTAPGRGRSADQGRRRR